MFRPLSMLRHERRMRARTTRRSPRNSHAPASAGIIDGDEGRLSEEAFLRVRGRPPGSEG